MFTAIVAHAIATEDTYDVIGSSPLESPLIAYKDYKIAQIGSLANEARVSLRILMDKVIWPRAWDSLATMEDVLQGTITFSDWTAEEDELLWAMTWADLSTNIFIGRRRDQCEQCYIEIAGFHLDTIFPTTPSNTKYNWTVENLLKYGEGREKNMTEAQIAAMFPQLDFIASDVKVTVK
jgi:hypothetical protein